MRNLLFTTALAVALLPVAQAGAQGAAPAPVAATPEVGGVRPEAEVYMVTPGGCPTTGYSTPIFGAFGPNGDSQMGYEIAGPCISTEVKYAASAIGMGRNTPIGLKNISRARFSSEGTLNGQAVKTTAFMNYHDPSVRLIIEGPAGKQVQVAHRGQAWNETEPGVGETAAPAAAAVDRIAMLKMTPHGAMLSIIEAEGHATVTKRGGKTILRGASPYDKIDVTITLANDQNALDNRPEMVQFRHGGHRYEARFYDYAEHWDTGMSPNYGVWFPSRIVWTMDGRPMADLKTTDFKQNAYMVFPRPSQIEAMAAEPEQRGDLLTPLIEEYKKLAASGAVYLAPAPLNQPYTPPATRLDPNVGLAITRSVIQGQTPRRQDGKPDLNGAWGAGGPPPVTYNTNAYGRRGIDTFEQDQATMQRANQWNMPLYKPENWQKVHEMDFSTFDLDPEYHCWGHRGTPREGPPNRIAMVDSEIWLRFGNHVRIVRYGRPLTAEDKDYGTWYGVSSANWAGDTLLLDSVGYGDESWLRWQGYFHSFYMEVQERLKREGNKLYWQNTVYDPTTMIRPWTSDVSVRQHQPNADQPEEPGICSERDSDGIVDKYYRG